MTSSDRYVYPAPAVYVDGKPYFDACAEGKLLVQQCAECREFHFYPRTLCPYCFSDKTEWVQSSGKGAIYTYSVMRAKPPYAIAYVTLEEGVTMLTHVVDCAFDELRIGMPVKVVCRQSKDGPFVPVFAPLE